MATPKGRSPRRETSRSATSGSTHPKRSESERIAEHIADFERGGGRVEVLGTTRVLQKVDAPAATETTPDASAAPRKRKR
ncbi:hypothetical protein [Lysobacter sp. A3-1-A15]|uniref:hypothetical protein n=1 Tax=Novilysobacter viscosus TaxID=3098602 RepID=UPI002EDB082D